jgi:hypothetical protein
VDPNRKRRRRKLAVKLGAGTPDLLLDAEVRGMSDEELLREADREVSGEAEAERQRAATEKADPVTGYLKHLTDDALLEEYRAAQAELEGRGLRVVASGGPGEVNIVPIEPMRPSAAFVEAAPPVEPHPVELAEPKPATPKVEETPRQKWEREQHEKITAAIAEAAADGELIARLAHEQGKRARSETMGPSEFLDALDHNNGRTQ